MNPSVIKDRFALLQNPDNITSFLDALSEYTGYILWIPNSKMVTHELAFDVTTLLQQNSTLEMLLSDAKYFGILKKFWKSKKQLSSGMMLVSLGINVYEQIHLYGFWPFEYDATGRYLPMHYSEDLDWSTFPGNHDYSFEFKVLTKLHSDGVLKLHIDKCSL
ncbi:alpha-N-acetylneuraminide alpha-2,8-sialyltransferase-like [Saccoglossus kowalevskii]